MNLHLHSIHEGVRFPCNLCGYPAAQKQKLNEHMKAIHGDKSVNNVQREHSRKSALGKMYKCALCDYQADKKCHLVRHQDSAHNKKYQCSECDFQAGLKAHLIFHQESVHEGKKYPCDMCNYQAVQENRLTLHKRSAHAIKTDAEIWNF